MLENLYQKEEESSSPGSVGLFVSYNPFLHRSDYIELSSLENLVWSCVLLSTYIFFRNQTTKKVGDTKKENFHINFLLPLLSADKICCLFGFGWSFPVEFHQHLSWYQGGRVRVENSTILLPYLQFTIPVVSRRHCWTTCYRNCIANIYIKQR